MWWKKVLYGLLVLVLGIGIATLSGSIAFNALSNGLLYEASSNKDYRTIESFFNYVSVIDSEKYVIEDKDTVHFEMYPCLVSQPYFKKNGVGEYYVKYDIVEMAIGLSFFNLPDDFSYKDNDTKGEVLLELENGTNYHVYINNVTDNEDSPNYHIDFSDFINEYYSFNIYVTYNDFIKQTENEGLNIKSVSLVDGNGSLFYKKVITKQLNFKLSFFAKYKEAAQNYREYMLLYGEGHSVTTFERKEALLQKINQITKENIEIFIARPSKTIVLSDTRYVLTISLTIAIYLSIAIVVTKIIFFKKN